MKKLLLALTCCLVLGGCSSGNLGVSQEQYESVVAERDELQAQIESIASLLEELDNNTNMVETEPKTQQKEQDKPQKIVLLDSGWCSYKSGDWAHVPYAVQIENPNTDYAVEYPTITITAKDSEGKILSTDDMTLNSIAANDIIFYGNEIFYEGSEPAEVEISVSNNERNFAKQDGEKYVMQNDFVISNVSENNGTFKSYTGEISNNSEVDFDTVAIIVIYKREDRIIGGEAQYVDDLMGKSTKPFELSSDSDEFEYDSYEIYAIQW